MTNGRESDIVPNSSELTRFPLIGADLFGDWMMTDEGNAREDRWLSVEQIAEYVGVSRDTVYAWLASGRMPGYKVGRQWRVKMSEVDGWIRGGHAEERPSHDEEER